MPVILDLHDVTDAAQSVMHDFISRRKIFESMMTIIKRYSRNVNDSKDKLSLSLVKIEKNYAGKFYTI